MVADPLVDAGFEVPCRPIVRLKRDASAWSPADGVVGR